jgi:hypothetical protein
MARKDSPGLIRGNGTAISLVKSTSSYAFPGPVKFPSVEEVQNLLNPHPKIPVSFIQDVAVNQCGVPTKDVQASTLMSSNAPLCGEGPSVTQGRGKVNVNDE